MKKIMTMLLAALLALSMTACGKEQETEPVETEPAIVAKNEVLTSVEMTTAVTTTTEPDMPDTPSLSLEESETGKELAVLKVGDKELSLKTGDVLSDILSESGLQYIEWAQAITDIPALSYYGKGYALHDVSKEQDLPEDYSPAVMFLEVADASQNRAENLEEDKAQYTLCGVLATADDLNPDDFTVTFAGGVTAGMSREDIEKALGDVEDEEKTLYVIEDDSLAILVSYDSENIADSIYALPASLVNIPESTAT